MLKKELNRHRLFFFLQKNTVTESRLIYQQVRSSETKIIRAIVFSCFIYSNMTMIQLNDVLSP